MAETAKEWANGRVAKARLRQGAFDFLGQAPKSNEPFPLREVVAEAWAGAICAWCERGYAITFGLTRDGGAIGVHLLAGGDKVSEYLGSVSELESFLSVVAANMEERK